MKLSSDDPEENWWNSGSSWRKASPTQCWLIKMILAQYPRRQPTTTSVRQSRADSGTCRINGWARKRKKSSPLQTERTRRRSMVHYRQSLVQGALEPPHFLVQMEAHFWQTKTLSWNGGSNTSIVCLIAYQLSMIMPSTDCHRWSAMYCLTNFPTVTETTKANKFVIRQSPWFRRNTCRDLYSKAEQT